MSLPTIKPILLTPRAEPFDDPDWSFEMKYDGFRAVAYIENGACRSSQSAATRSSGSASWPPH